MGLLLALVIWVITLVSVIVVKRADTGMPPAFSEAARGIDAQFFLTLVIVGVAFVLAQGLLGWFVFKYRDRPEGRVRYVHGNNLIEIGGAVLVGVVFIALAIAGQKVWARVHLSGTAPNSLIVEITGEQFAWNVRYPGPDGVFGRTSPSLYDPNSNPVGLVPDDPAGQDDIVTLNSVAVPVNRPVELVLASKDVLHSFFIPVLWIKQDTVPGMQIPLRFTADQTGEFEVLCAELCGLGHYRMRGMLLVLEPDEFGAWLEEKKGE